MAEKIMTLHPQGKQGVNIDKGKYDTIRSAIEHTLQAQEGLSFTELNQAIHEQLSGSFDGSISWYVTTVKLDLEARGIVTRVGRSPQRLQLV